MRIAGGTVRGITRRVKINPEKYNQIKELTIRGIKVPGELSPYDIPRQATTGYDPSTRAFRIDFVYLTPDEPRQENKISKEISLFLGKRSGKLYGVVIKGQEPGNLEKIRVELVAEVKNLAEAAERDAPRDYVKILNLEAAKKMLEEEHDLYRVAQNRP